jgi:glycosyltransferase involved in cell wall biosynthesis
LITDQFEIDVKYKKISSEYKKIIRPKGPPIKKVLYIGPWKFAPNVGKKNVRIIYPSLFEPLHDCEFHILHGKPELPEYTKELVERYGVVFHRIEGRKIRKWIAKATSLTKELDIDVLTNVFFGYRHGYVAAKVAQNTRRKSVVRFAANEIFVRKCSGAFRGLRGKARYLKEKIMEIRAILMANEVIAMSPWEVKRIKNLTLSPDKVKWCMRGIDVNGYAPPQERKYRVARNFLFVGRKRKEKGYQLIETVAKNLFPKYPDIRFYFAGDFEPGKEENRSYLGYCSHDKLKKLYYELDALILPSESEGFANVIVEAMSMGMPCIISKSYHEEYFKHKKDAMLIDLTVRELEENIIELYNDINLIARLSTNARALAKKEYDSKKWADRYREIIIG